MTGDYLHQTQKIKGPFGRGLLEAVRGLERAGSTQGRAELGVFCPALALIVGYVYPLWAQYSHPGNGMLDKTLRGGPKKSLPRQKKILLCLLQEKEAPRFILLQHTTEIKFLKKP